MKISIVNQPIIGTSNISIRVSCMYCSGSTQEGACEHCGGYVSQEEANKWKQWQEELERSMNG